MPLTRIHDCFRPQILHTISVPLRTLILVDGACAPVFRLVLRLNLTVVYAVLELHVLKHILHLLLQRNQKACEREPTSKRALHTSSLARASAALVT